LHHVLGAGASEEGLSSIGLAAHEVLGLGIMDSIPSVWRDLDDASGETAAELLALLEPIKQKVLDNYRKWYRNRDLQLPNDFEANLNHVLHDLMVSFLSKIMVAHPPPRRVLTELAITNVRKQHEGRLDVLLEYGDGRYLIIDWKTSPEPAHSYGYNHMQVLSNALLANYRYHQREEDFSGCKAAVVHCDGVFWPRIPPTPATIRKVQDARAYILECLTGRGPPAEAPYWAQCVACPDQRNCEFYKRYTMLDREGALPRSYSDIRRLLFRRRTVVLEERANIHVDKFVVDYAVSQSGEQGLSALEDVGIVERGYSLKNVQDEFLILQRHRHIGVFEKRNPVRLIGIEPNVPLFACINARGNIHEVKDSSMTVRVSSTIAAERAFRQLQDLPILVTRDNVDLTARELEPLHFFDVFAAEKLVPW